MHFVESRTLRAYCGLPQVVAIVALDDGTRVYMEEGLSIEGSSQAIYRFRTGEAVSVLKDDTLDSLLANRKLVLFRAWFGLDDARKPLDWDGEQLEAVAMACGYRDRL